MAKKTINATAISFCTLSSRGSIRLPHWRVPVVAMGTSRPSCLAASRWMSNSIASLWQHRRSLELIGHLVQRALHAGLALLAARRAGDAGRAYDLFANLDRQRAASSGEAGEILRAH